MPHAVDVGRKWCQAIVPRVLTIDFTASGEGDCSAPATYKPDWLLGIGDGDVLPDIKNSYLMRKDRHFAYIWSS